MKYTQLKNVIQHLEAKWQPRVRTRFPANPDPCMLNGQVQFFVVDNDPESTADEELPIVVLIGSNYTQENKFCPWLSPYLRDDPSGNPIVIDLSGLSAMRTNLKKTFGAYSGNQQAWVDRHLASANNIHVPDRFLLVVTNFSPFITCYSWQDYESAERANLLSLLDGSFAHLDDLAVTLKDNVRLWVAHGLGAEVFSLFRLWQVHRSVTPWLLTSNLSFPFTGAFYHRPRLCCTHCADTQAATQDCS